MYLDAMEDNPLTTRPRAPNPAYKGRNGYEESTSQTQDEAGATIEDDDSAPPTAEQLIQHRMAQYILTQKDKPIPT
jgi:hypothetical protein